jgi:hypothetical protein
MKNAQNSPMPKEPAVELIGEGLLLGGKTGLRVSMLYITVGLIVMEFLGRGLISSPVSPSWGFWGKVILTILAGGVVFIFSIVPGTIIGALTGMYFGLLTKLLGERQRISKYLFLAMCGSSCFIAVILFHILFRGPIADSLAHKPDLFTIGNYGTYPFIIGIPSVLYILIGTWLAWKLHSKVGIQ